jgi:hypothetical protein
MEEITLVPLPPHPIIPSLTVEFAAEPKTVSGLRTVTAAEAAAAVFKNDLRSIVVSITPPLSGNTGFLVRLDSGSD